jgi:hypothetical protein
MYRVGRIDCPREPLPQRDGLVLSPRNGGGPSNELVDRR